MVEGKGGKMRTINDYLLNIHTPNGRTFPRLDCWGLIVDFYREILGIQLNEYTDLDAGTMSRGFMYERESGRFIEVHEPQDGDLIAFFFRGKLFHVGIYWKGRILHTSQQKNCRYELLQDRTLNDRRFYRYVSH